MKRPSETLLVWLRDQVSGRGLTPADLAKKTDLPKARIRKILVGAEPMLVDELLQLSNALELQPGDLQGAAEEPRGLAVVPGEDNDPDALPASTDPTVDPWGNQPEQLFKVGFALGCDFFFLARADDLAGCGVPRQILDKYRGGDLPIKLDADYHSYYAPRYDDEGVTLTLSFDAIYDCRFPWSTIRQIVFFPISPDKSVDTPSLDEEPKKPHLRLVT